MQPKHAQHRMLSKAQEMLSNMQDVREVLSLGQAAKMADCSRDTIRRAAQRQELPAKMGPGKRGPQWWVREADLLDWLQDRSQLSTPSAQQSTAAEQNSAASSAEQAGKNFEDAVYEVTSPAPVTEAQQSKASSAEQAEHVEENFDYDSRVVSADVHQAVISELVDELRRADRQTIALQIQLSQNTNLLAAKSESLLKQEAEDKARNARNEELENEKAAHAQQAKQAQQELAQVKAEAEKATAELAEARAQLNRIEEHQSAPFWKRWFQKPE